MADNVLISCKRLHIQRYDWNEAQRKLEQFSHYKMPVQDLNLHFIHEVRTSERRSVKETRSVLQSAWLSKSEEKEVCDPPHGRLSINIASHRHTIFL